MQSSGNVYRYDRERGNRGRIEDGESDERYRREVVEELEGYKLKV